MTSEVAILNRMAVVVAADSAVTTQRSKVHTSANKIFSISVQSSIGAMIYGNAEFQRVPWETILKLFRDETKEQKFSTVSDCWNELSRFLVSQRILDKDGGQLSLGLLCSDLALELVQSLRKYNPLDLRKNFSKILKALLTDLEETKCLEHLRIPTRRRFSSKFGDLIFQCFSDVLYENLKYKLPKKYRRNVIDIAYEALRSEHTSEYQTGLVLFGFGEDEIMPTVVAVSIDGVFDGSLRCTSNQTFDVSRDNYGGRVIAFADREMIGSFIEGTTDRVRNIQKKLMAELSSEVIPRVIGDNFTVSDDEMKIIQRRSAEIVNEISTKYEEVVFRFVQQNYVNPMMHVVGSLPKEDMAKLAESLVEVTALRKKVAFDVESVGGVVDVATVTKGDGLVWIKRKHYFDIEKNLQFAARKLGI